MKRIALDEFEVLTYIERHQNDICSYTNLAHEIFCPLDRLMEIMDFFKSKDLIKERESFKYSVTDKGYEVLEPYRVKRAIFIAAGFGSRMVPATLKTPKPLIRVNGVRIIEPLLDALLEAEIEEIIIVRGYLGEQFDALLDKYPMIKFIENPLYNVANNISSVYLVRELLQNAYLLESDLLLYNKNLLRKYEYGSNCLGMAVNYTDDWCFETEQGYIKKLHIGGENVYHEYGISYWSKEDGYKLKQDYEKVFHSPGGKERYYDEVPFNEYKDHYKVRVRPVQPGSIVEIDTYSELQQIDSTYK